MVYAIELAVLFIAVASVMTDETLTGPNVCETEVIVTPSSGAEWRRLLRIEMHAALLEDYCVSWFEFQKVCERVSIRRKKIRACCEGYASDGLTCQPICIKNCYHGRCIAPGKCKCFDGWRGYNCISNCPYNKWGPECNSTCSCGNGASCDPQTGACTCSKGWEGKHCDEPCKGRYGYFCEEECRCENNALCDHVSGSCNCTTGYQGPLCREKCPKDSHGYQCSEECKCQNNALCHHEDGSCECTPGWRGPICADRCEEGYFGINCSEKCHCYNDATCNFITGECNCTAGYYSDSCQIDCPPGTWGLNCSQECNCTNGECNKVDGSCSCFVGFVGKNCQKRVCPSRKWGKNCLNECKCKHEMECHPVTGECWCSDEWRGVDCSLNRKEMFEKQNQPEENKEGVNVWTIILALSNSLTILLLVVLIIKYHKKCSQPIRIEDESLLPSYAELTKEDQH